MRLLTNNKVERQQHWYQVRLNLEYMAAVFRGLTDSDESAMQLALEFYGLYSVYDEAQDKESVS